jgi:hypothetical protein
MQNEIDVLEKLKSNEFINHETFEMFALKKMGLKWGKRMHFPEKEVKDTKQELL